MLILIEEIAASRKTNRNLSGEASKEQGSHSLNPPTLFAWNGFQEDASTFHRLTIAFL